MSQHVRLTSLPVVPHEGTWIEIIINLCALLHNTSFPTRERGLKFYCDINTTSARYVVPHEGTWIEIIINLCALLHNTVVPHEGTWIEMPFCIIYN